MKLYDWLKPLLVQTEIDFRTDVRKAGQFIHTEEKDIEAVITDALNALSAAKDAVLAKIASTQSALTQAETDRDQAKADLATAQQQLADAENQINAITAQLNPPSA
jgi:chromosome segregation ATPase